MVNDILDYSQLQSGYLRLNLEDINLGELAESETSRCLAAAKKHGIRLEFKSSVPELMIHGDPLKLSQVMRNLLYNAINHTPEGGTITVWLKAGEHSFRLEVQNPGDPIPGSRPEAHLGAVPKEPAPQRPESRHRYRAFYRKDHS